MKKRRESERKPAVRDAGPRRPSRAAGLLLALVATLAAPGAGEAARLTDVRVGRHSSFTRVVLELDALAPYRLEEPLAGRIPELRVLVAAESAARALAPGAPLVRSVRVEPGELGAAVRIELTTAAVRVEELILAGPPRIVLDLRRAPEGAAPEAAIEPAEDAEPSPPEAAPGPPEEEPSRPAAVPSVESSPPATAAPTTGVPEPPEAVESPTAAVPPDIAEVAPEEDVELPTAVAPPDIAEAAPEEAVESPAATPPEAPVGLAPRASPAARAARVPDRSWSVGRIGGLAVLAAAIVLLAFALWWRLRRGPAAREQIVPEAEEARGVVAPPPPERAPELPVGERGLPAEEVRRRFEEVTQRLERLDARLDEFLDARERLGRALEAQGEELRVQRAAIARLQRLARFLARREDREEEGLRRSPWS